MSLQGVPFLGPSCSYLSPTSVATLTYFATQTAAQIFRDSMIRELATFVQLLQVRWHGRDLRGAGWA